MPPSGISFNGATSQGRGRPESHFAESHALAMLQWGHVSRTWKTIPSASVPVWPDWLQWGHVSRTWKTRRASQRTRRSRSRFNGATSQGRGRLVIPTYCKFLACSLQWGHVSRTWKTLGMPLVLVLMDALQWGHVSRTWKTIAGRGIVANRPRASMGPRLKDVEDDVLRRAAGAGDSASMGPRLKDVEDSIRLCVSVAASVASMGPRLKDVEDNLLESLLQQALGASMGPRLKDVEDIPATTVVEPSPRSFNGATSQGRGRLGSDERPRSNKWQLQWGHVSRTWKTRPPITTRTKRRRLQWGHVSRTWKTRHDLSPRGRDVGFNGATSQGRGRLLHRKMFPLHGTPLQWGHVSRTWKTTIAGIKHNH